MNLVNLPECFVLAPGGQQRQGKPYLRLGIGWIPGLRLLQLDQCLLEEAARTGKFQIFARVDFQALAAANGGKVKPNQILIFGRGGILPPLLPVAPTVAIDLPFKFLAWEDGDGKSWLACNSAAYMKERHALAGQDEQMKRIGALMARLAAGVVEQ